VSKVGAYFKLARIDHGVIAAVAVAVGYAIGANGWYGILRPPAILAMVVAVLAEIALFTFNDVLNIEEDRINAPDRPLVRGEVGVREAVVLGAACTALSLMLAALLGIAPLTILAVALTSGMLYNFQLKRRGLLGNVVVALDTSLPFTFGSTVVRGFNVPLTVTLFTLIAFTAALGREVLKGIRDLEGDLRAGIRTLAATRGVRVASRVSSALLLAAPFLSIAPLPLIGGWGKCVVYTILVSVTDFLFTYTAISILLKPERGVAEIGRRLTLLGMLTGTLAFASTA